MLKDAGSSREVRMDSEGWVEVTDDHLLQSLWLVLGFQP